MRTGHRLWGHQSESGRTVGASEQLALLGRQRRNDDGQRRGRFVMRVTSLSRADTIHKVVGRVLITCKQFVPDLLVGDSIVCKVRLSRPQPARNPGGFDYAAYLNRKGYQRTGRIVDRSDLSIIARMSRSRGDAVVGRIRSHVRATIRGDLSGAPAALLEGVLLGDKSQVPDGVREAFSRSGVSHVLAVSGLHVGLFAVGVFFCARSFGARGIAVSILKMCAVWLYAAVTGMPASVVRAASVATLVVWARSGQRRVDGLNSLGVPGTVLLTFRPLDLYDLGFQLSFVATGGILFLHKLLTELLSSFWGRRWRTWVAVPVAVSIAAQFSTASLIISAFGQISLIATVVNMIVVPLMSASVGVGLITVTIAAVWPDCSTVLNGANWLLLESALWFAWQCAGPEWAAVACSLPPVPVLVDGGIAGYGEDADKRVTLPALNDIGITELEAVIASHPHADHVGDWKADVLKAAHHGSRTSSTSAFLRAVDSGWIAISCGIRNKFKHPSPEVLDRYDKIGTRTHRTDLLGCVTYRLQEGGVEVRGYLE